MATNDRSLGFSVFFTSEGVEALKRVLAELSGQLDTLGKKVVAPELDIDDRKGKEKVGAFARDLQARIDAAIKALPSIELKAEATDVDRRIAAIRAELEAISHARVGVGIDAPGVHERIQELSAELRRLGTESANVKVTAGTAEAAAQLDEIGAKRVHVPVEVDTAPADAEVTVFARVLHERISAAIRSLPAVDVHAGSSDVDRRIAEIRAELDSLSDRRVTVTATGVVETAARVQQLSTELVVLGEQSPEVKVRAEATRAAADLRGIKRLSDDVSKVVATARVVADTETASENIGSFARGLVTRIDAAVASLPVVQLREDSTEVDQGVARLRTELSELSGKVKFGADASEVDTRVREIKTELTELGSRTTDVSVKADTAEAAANLAALTKRPERVELEVGTARGAAEVSAFADTLQTRITAAIKALPAVGLRVGDDDVQRRVAEIRIELAGLSQELIRPDLDPANVDRKVRVLARELDELGARTTNIAVKADTAEAAANLNGLKTTATAPINIPVHAEQGTVDELIGKLREIHDKRVNLEITAREAATQLDEIVARLAVISGSHPDVTVRAHAGEALREVSALLTELVEVGRGATVPLAVDAKPATAAVDRFAADLETRITAAIEALPEIDLKATASDVDRRISEIRAELVELAHNHVGVDVDAPGVHERLQALSAELKHLGTESANLQVKANTAEAAANLDAIGAKRVTVPVEVTTAPADAEVATFSTILHERITAAIRSLPAVEIHAGASDVDRRISEIRAELITLADKRVTVTADGVVQTAARVQALSAELVVLGEQSPTVTVRSEVTRAAADLRTVTQQRDALSDHVTVAKVVADTQGASENIGSFARNLVARIDAAIAALPVIELREDSGDVDRGIARLHAELTGLSARIKIGADPGAAVTEVHALTAELKELSTNATVLSVKADTADAAAHLDSLAAKHLRTELEVNTDHAGTQVGLFATELRQRITAAIKALPAVALRVGSDDVQRRVAEIRTELLALSHTLIKPDVDPSDVDRRVRVLSRELDELGTRSPNIAVKADTAEAVAELDGLGSKHVQLGLDINTAKAITQLDTFTQSMHAKVHAAIRALPAIDLHATSPDVDRRIGEIRAELQELSNRIIRVEIDSTEAHNNLRALARELDELSSRSSSVRVRADTAEASAKLAELDNYRFTATLSLDTAAADATVSVFAQEVRSRLLAAVRALPAVVLRADTTDVDRRIAAIRSELADLADHRINIGIDDAEALTRLRALSAELHDLGTQSVSIRVRTDTAAAVAELDALSRHPVTTGVHLDITGAQIQVTELAAVIEARLTRAIRSLPAVTLGVESSAVQRRIAEIRAELVALSAHTIGVDVDIATASEKLRRLAAELTDVGAMSPDVTVRVNTTEAVAALRGVKTSVGDLDGRTVEIGVDTGRAREEVTAFARSLQERITAAIRALPEIRLTADSTNVDRRITEIRAELVGLVAHRIGVDVHTSDAMVAIRALVAELDELSTHNPRITATADMIRAATALDGIRRDITELNGHRIVIGVDVKTEGARTEVGAFARDLQTRIDTAIRALAPVKLKVDATDIDTRVAAIRTELTSLSDRRIGIGVDADEAFAQVEALTTALDALGVRNPTPRVTVDDHAALVVLDSVQRKLDDFAGRRVTAHLDIRTVRGLAQVDDFARELQTRLQAAVRALPHIELRADATDVERTLFAVNAELRALSDRRIGIDVSETDALAKIAVLHRELDELTSRHVNIPVTLGFDRAAVEDFRNMLDRLTDKSITIETHGADATAQVDDLWSKLIAIGKLNPETTVTVHTAEALAGIEHVSVALDHMQAKLDGIDTGKITALAAALKSINAQPVTVTPHVDTGPATAKLAALTKPVSVPVRAQPTTTTGTPLGVPQTPNTATSLILTANSNPFDIKIAQANIKLDELRAKKASPELDLKISALEAKRDQAIAALAVLQRTNVTPKATVDMVSLFADLGKARAQLADLNTKRASPEIDLKVAHGEAQLTQFRIQLDELNTRKVNPEIDFYVGKSEEALARTNAQLTALAAKKATPEVLADISRFQLKAGTIEDTIARLNALRATPKLDADIVALEAKIALAEERLRTLNAQKASPKLDAEADVLESKIEKLVERIHILDAQTSNSKLGADITTGLVNIDTIEEKLRAYGREKASSKLDVDIIAAEANIAKLTAERDVFNKKTAAKADLDLNTSKAEANAGQFATKLQTNLERAIKSLPSIELKDNATDEEKRIRAIRDELVAIADKKIGVGITTDEARLRIKELETELKAVERKTPTLSLRADVSAARTAMDDVGKAADEAGRKGKAAGANLGLNTQLVNRWQQLGAAILVAATAAGPALLALGGVAAAGTTGILQTGLGVKTLFSGVGTGAKAIETADKQQTSQAATLAAQQVSSANAVTAANQAVASSIRGVTDATRAAATANTNADRTVRDSKRSVTDAIRGEADAQRSAGLSEANAVYAEGQAEDSLQKAQQGELRAQQALTDARKAAQRELENLNLQVKDAALAERAAVLGIQQAQENLNKLLDTTAGTQKTLIQAEEDYARAVATGTKAEQDKARAILDTIRTKAQGPTAALDRAQAQLAFDQAVQHLEDQKVHNKQLAADKADADRRGVEGSEKVINAQQGVTAATEATENAQHSLAQAQLAVVESQRAGAESIAKAQEQVAKANEAVGVAQAAQIETQRAGLESITKANEAQVAAQRSLENVTAQAAKVGVTSLDTLKSALDALSPAGRLFAYFLHDTLTPQLHDIRDAVQAAGLPKMKTALENLGALGPTITTGLAGTASVIGDLAIQGSKMVTSGPWKADFVTVMARNNRVLSDFGHAGLSTADAFRNIATSAGPLEERLAKLGEAGARSFQVWIQGQRDSGQLDKFFHDAGDEAIQLVKVFGQLATAAVNLITAVHPISGVFVAVIGKLAEWTGMLARANPTVIATVAAVGTLFGILSKLTGVSIGGILKGDAFVGLGSKIESAALSAGVFTEKVTGSAAAGEKIAVAGEKAGSVMSKLGAALPVVGVAVIGLSVAYDHFITRADGAATAMLKGGAAADEATAALKKQQDGVFASREEIAKATGGFSELGRGLQDWLIPGVKQATDEFNKQRAAMDPLTRAQSDVTRAQAEYARAIETNDLPRAARAQKDFAAATAEAARQTAIQTDGLKSDDQILAEHRDLLLGNLNGEIRVKDEMVAVTKGVAEHGKSVDTDTEAGRRNLEGLNNLTGTMNDNLTAMQKNGAAQADITNKANEYKTSLFNQAIQIGYTKDQAQHYVDTVLSIPKDRYTNFANNAPGADAQMQGYLAAINRAQGAYVATFFADTNPAQQVINQFLRNNSALNASFVIGGMLPRATGGIDVYAPMAAGGLRSMDPTIANVVPPNTPTIIGDHTSVNESYIPWTRTPRTDQIFDTTAAGIGRTVLPRGTAAPTPMAAGGINGPGSSDRDPSQPVAVEVGPRTLAMFTDLAKVLRDYTTMTRPLPSPVASLAGASDRGDTTAKYRDVALNVTPVVIRQVTQNAADLVTAGARIVQPTAGGVVRGTSSAVRTGNAEMNPTAFAGVIEAAITRALSARPAGPPVALSPGAEAAMTRAVSSGVHGAELRIRDDGQGGIARIANRQNRDQARR